MDEIEKNVKKVTRRRHHLPISDEVEINKVILYVVDSGKRQRENIYIASRLLIKTSNNISSAFHIYS